MQVIARAVFDDNYRWRVITQANKPDLYLSVISGAKVIFSCDIINDMLFTINSFNN